MPITKESMRILVRSITGDDVESDDIATLRRAVGAARRAWRDQRGGPVDMDVTDEVSRWIINDGDHYHAARARAMDTVESLETYIRSVLADAPHQSAAWHVSNELSVRDLDRIDWPEVADDLIGD
jgi:hypothetical protein